MNAKFNNISIQTGKYRSQFAIQFIKQSYKLQINIDEMQCKSIVAICNIHKDLIKLILDENWINENDKML